MLNPESGLTNGVGAYLTADFDRLPARGLIHSVCDTAAWYASLNLDAALLDLRV